MKVPADLAIPHATGHSHAVALTVDRYRLIETLERNEVLSRVRDVVERMARAEHLQLALASDQFLNVLDRFGIVQPAGAVCIVAGPILLMLNHVGPFAESM